MNKIESFYDRDYREKQYQSKEVLDLFKYLDVINKGKALDVGVGLGPNIKTLIDSGFEVSGIDISSYAISELSREYPNCDFHVSDILDFEMKSDEYDLILCSMVLHHLDEAGVEKAVEKMKQGLKKGGVIYVSMLSDRDPTANRSNFPTDDYLNTIRSNLSLVQVQNLFNGFETILAHDLYFWDSNRTKEFLKYYGIVSYIGRK